MHIKTWQTEQKVIQNYFEYKCDFCGKTSDNKYAIQECEKECMEKPCQHISGFDYKFKYELKKT